jgi:hypothetical protein
VSSITIQADVLQLLRQILVTWLPRSELIKGVLLHLPHVNPQVRLGRVCVCVCVRESE